MATGRLAHVDGPVLDAFHRAVAYHACSRVGKLRRAPVRSVAVKVGSAVGARTGLSVPFRVRTFWGAVMRVRLPEAVSNQLLCCGLFEPGLTAFMLRLLGPGHCFVDVGAHFGYFTLLAAHLVGAAGRVDAFEPTPSTFGVLARNVAHLPNVLASQVAVWSERSQLTVTDLGTRLSAFNSVFAPRLGGDAPTGTRAGQVRVDAVSLDDYCAARGIRPHFVKIDAESAEHRIVQGMDGLLARARPLLSLEVGDFDIAGVPSSSTLLRAVLARDYLAFEYADGAIRPHTVRERYQYDNILLAPREHPFARGLADA
jgi:FkbM family methyltransferase